MSVRNATEQVLRNAGYSLHVREITEQILARKLWKPQGKTPAATVSAQLYSDIKKHGEKSRFVLTAPQTFGLRESGAKRSPAATLPPAKPAAVPPPATATTVYSFTDAAENVLETFGDKKPMHYRQITDKARKLNWVATEGRTPEATMYAQILTEIRRHQRCCKQPRFVQHGRGYVGLSRWMGKGLVFEIEQHNRQVRQAFRKRLLGLKPKEFEELIGLLLVEMGFEDIEVVGQTGDGGIDVRAMLVVGDVIRIRMAVQVKKWKIGNNVQSPDVQRVRGSLGTHDQGLIITTSDFSPGAHREAERADAVPVALMNGEQLSTLLAEYELGITRQSCDLIDISETGHD